jgi:hypothetical protein
MPNAPHEEIFWGLELAAGSQFKPLEEGPVGNPTCQASSAA